MEPLRVGVLTSQRKYTPHAGKHTHRQTAERERGWGIISAWDFATQWMCNVLSWHHHQALERERERERGWYPLSRLVVVTTVQNTETILSRNLVLVDAFEVHGQMSHHDRPPPPQFKFLTVGNRDGPRRADGKCVTGAGTARSRKPKGGGGNQVRHGTPAANSRLFCH